MKGFSKIAEIQADGRFDLSRIRRGRNLVFIVVWAPFDLAADLSLDLG